MTYRRDGPVLNRRPLRVHRRRAVSPGIPIPARRTGPPLSKIKFSKNRTAPRLSRTVLKPSRIAPATPRKRPPCSRNVPPPAGKIRWLCGPVRGARDSVRRLGGLFRHPAGPVHRARGSFRDRRGRSPQALKKSLVDAHHHRHVLRDGQVLCIYPLTSGLSPPIIPPSQP